MGRKRTLFLSGPNLLERLPSGKRLCRVLRHSHTDTHLRYPLRVPRQTAPCCALARCPSPPVRALILPFVCATMLSGCAGRPNAFSDQNARAHVNQLAGAIGSRPAGSDANRRAREYLIDQLRFFGYTVRVQEAQAAAGRTSA